MKICLAITLVFMTVTAALTFTARSIHNARLPRVTAQRLTREIFDDGYTRKLAVPKTLYEKGEIFIIVPRVINGEKRDTVQSAILKTGQENEGFREVTGGLFGNELVVFDSDRPLHNGDEVFIVK